MDFSSNIRSTRLRTRATEQVNAYLQNDDKAPNRSSEDTFEASIADNGGSGIYNGRELPSTISEFSSTSSARRNRIHRELARLEEERRLMEAISQERMAKERALNEKEHWEKLERGKQFIARKHELLSWQDDEDAKSVRSLRSGQGSARRKSDWVNQTKAAESSGKVVVEQTSTSTSVEADQLSVASLGNPHVVHCSSTPQKDSACAIPETIGEGLEVESIPGTIDSVTIGESPEDSIEGGHELAMAKCDRKKDQIDMPLVDLQPFVDLLDVNNIISVTSKTSTAPKLIHPGTETEELSDQGGCKMQQKTEWIRDLPLENQLEIDVIRKREMDLVNKIDVLNAQHGEEMKRIQGSEEGLRTQLESRGHQLAALQDTIKYLENQHVAELERFRQSEVDLRIQLEHHSREQAEIQKQHSELEKEIMRLQATEQELQSQLLATRQREQEGIRLRSEAEEEYRALRDEVQKMQEDVTQARNGIQSSINTYSSSLQDPRSRIYYLSDNSRHLIPPVPPPPSPIVNKSLPSSRREHIRDPGVSPIHPELFPIEGFAPNPSFGQFGQLSQQLAARQVVTEELPIFSGDAVDWPVFISSYQNSTDICGFSNAENLLRLQRSLRGSAKDAVSSFLLHPSTVPQIVATLQQLYGRPEQIVHNMIAKVRATPAPQEDRLETLVSFGLVVQNLCGYLKAVGLDRHLSNPILIQELVDKLPATAKFSWALYQEQVPEVDLNVFSSYMAKISSAASRVTQLVSIPTAATRAERTISKEKIFINTHTVTGPDQSRQSEEPLVERTSSFSDPRQEWSDLSEEPCDKPGCNWREDSW